jgi:hypothetical protein
MTSFTTKVALAAISLGLTGSSTFVYQTTQRVAALEAHRADDNERLSRIETKLDKALERIK